MDTNGAIVWGRDFTRLKLHGGRLPLDFTNTLHERIPERRGNFLEHYGDLLTWSLHAGAIDDEVEARRLFEAAQRQPDEAKRVHPQALHLREAIYGIFSAYLDGGTPPPADLAVFNAALSNALSNVTVCPNAQGDTFQMMYGGDPLALDRMLWVIAWQTAQLLTSPELARVRACGGCGWLFLDLSKNRSRRWCSMEICGNQAKARRHYQRQRRKD